MKKLRASVNLGFQPDTGCHAKCNSRSSGSCTRESLRPKMLQGMSAGDLGSWIYVAPDKKSGTMFQIGADGSVRGDPVSPAKLVFLAGS